MRTLNGHFDGKHVVLDETATRKPNTKVEVIPVENEETETDIAHDFMRLSEPVFRTIWDNALDAE